MKTPSKSRERGRPRPQSVSRSTGPFLSFEAFKSRSRSQSGRGRPRSQAIPFAFALALLVFLPAWNALAVNEVLINRKPDGSRVNAAHRINLLDAGGNKIAADDIRPEPLSTGKTCGECHDYAKIRQGWHFSLVTTATQPGHSGEPWLLGDRATFTQLPLSLRDWKGAWRPEQVGMTPWAFVKAFGSHLPGGGVAEVDANSTAALDLAGRWEQSGKLEANCLGCHSGSPHQDMAEYGAQIASGNLKWAAAAASGLATVEGSIKSLPAFYDVYQPSLDDPSVKPPKVAYLPAEFDAANKALLDIKGRPTAERCYYCHTTAHEGTEKHNADQDVHMTGGMTCVDCHRNGIDHQILRGAEEDAATPEAKALTCRGCHLGEDGKHAGRLGAPVPKHKGMPPVHLEKMSCTACHSGPAPEARTGVARTSRSHKLGTRTPLEAGLPTIVSPVYVKDAKSGQTRPCNMVWPSFWGLEKGGEITPLLPEAVTAAAGPALAARIDDTTGTETALNEGKVAAALKALALAGGDGEPVYVSGGKVHKLGAEGRLSAAEHEAAKPYAWPIAHEVRPAAQSLGVKGCTECHAPDAPFFFGAVEVADPLAGDKPEMKKMLDFEGQDIQYARMFGMSFTFRPYYKMFLFGSSALVLGVILAYLLLGLGACCRFFGRKEL